MCRWKVWCAPHGVALQHMLPACRPGAGAGQGDCGHPGADRQGQGAQRGWQHNGQCSLGTRVGLGRTARRGKLLSPPEAYLCCAVLLLLLRRAPRASCSAPSTPWSSLKRCGTVGMRDLCAAGCLHSWLWRPSVLLSTSQQQLQRRRGGTCSAAGGCHNTCWAALADDLASAKCKAAVWQMELGRGLTLAAAAGGMQRLLMHGTAPAWKQLGAAVARPGERHHGRPSSPAAAHHLHSAAGCCCAAHALTSPPPTIHCCRARRW